MLKFSTKYGLQGYNFGQIFHNKPLSLNITGYGAKSTNYKPTMGPFIPFYSPASDFVNFTLSAPLSVSFTENIILKQNKLPVLLFENNARQKIYYFPQNGKDYKVTINRKSSLINQ